VPTSPTSPTALIAEDEPLLAAALQAELALAWPELRIVAVVGDGQSAVQQALALQPDVLFFDIQMPVMSGLDAAFALAEEWPEPPAEGGEAARFKPFPQLVFVTAYDQYAIQAFDAQAVDYILKPVNQSRLKISVKKLLSRHVIVDRLAINFNDILHKLESINSLKYNNFGSNAASANSSAPAASPTPLRVIQASVGNTIRMVPIDEVVCFEAADKYLQVFAADGREYLIRTPLKDLLPQLDANVFWQVHRGTVVRAAHVEVVHKDEAGKLWLTLRGLNTKIAVSRLYAHLFRAM
jgi:DNA-binding LytR/AlgR family response regulator